MQVIERFIAQHGLHSTIPVDLTLLFDLYEVWRRPLDDGLDGMVLIGETGAIISLSADLDEYKSREVLAHEAAHVVEKHPNTLYLCRISEWLHKRYEREAQQDAALMLIPRKPLLDLVLAGAGEADLREAFKAPVDLIRLRLRLAKGDEALTRRARPDPVRLPAGVSHGLPPGMKEESSNPQVRAWERSVERYVRWAEQQGHS